MPLLILHAMLLPEPVTGTADRKMGIPGALVGRAGELCLLVVPAGTGWGPEAPGGSAKAWFGRLCQFCGRSRTSGQRQGRA